MPIVPLPQFEADVAELERERLVESLRCKGHDPATLEGLSTDELGILDAKKKPSTLVVRYGRMKMIGEFPYRGDMTPGCGSKVVVRTHRGTEIGEMLTSTCPNSGCGSSVSRKEMLEYIENSGGRQYPFSTDGRVLRIATKEDLDTQSSLEQSSHEMKMAARALAESLRLDMKIVEAEPILGGERLTFYYTSDDRIDFRELVYELGSKFRARVDMRQVGARDEARLTADYEKCGQYCCCKNFLKVLKPISMKSAKVQKATLDPVKISGRCGRLMCCLRYEDETYADLAKRLPRRKSLVGTPDGDGIVIQTQILTQLVLVRFEDARDDQAYPVEEIGKPGERPASSGPSRSPEPRAHSPKSGEGGGGGGGRRDRARRGDPPARETSPGPVAGGSGSGTSDAGLGSSGGAGSTGVGEPGGSGKKKRRRRRRRKPGGGETGSGGAVASDAPSADGAPSGGPRGSDADAGNGASGGSDGSPTRKKRRRRRRRRSGGDSGGASGGASGGGSDGHGGGGDGGGS